jgi:hypothetical protein
MSKLYEERLMQAIVNLDQAADVLRAILYSSETETEHDIDRLAQIIGNIEVERVKVQRIREERKKV